MAIQPSPLIVALDYPTVEPARAMVASLATVPVGMFKVGGELFTAAGPELVREIVRAGHRVFLDLKFHDIPNTVAGAVAAAVRLGASLVNVHAAGGAEMMRAAVEAARSVSAEARVIAVTVLTSLATGDLGRTGIARAPQEQALLLAELAAASGLDGVVASAVDAPVLRQRFPRPFLIVTPGIRPAGAAAGDQKRIATPAQAVQAGADYIVVGRPITAAPDPAAAAQRILDELRSCSATF